MSETVADSSSSGVEPAGVGLASVSAVVLELVKWILVLNVAAVWLLFWVSLARHHLAAGNSPAVVLSIVPLVVPVLVLLWRFIRR